MFPGLLEGETITSLRAYLQQVLAMGYAHHMAVQRYDVPNPSNPSQVLGRHWDPTNSTIHNVQGGVIGLLHSVVNVTEWMQAEAELRASEVCKRTQTQELEAATHHFV